MGALDPSSENEKKRENQRGRWHCGVKMDLLWKEGRIFPCRRYLYESTTLENKQIANKPLSILYTLMCMKKIIIHWLCIYKIFKLIDSWVKHFYWHGNI